MTNFCSKMFGKFASYPFPQPLQKWINQGYVKIFGIDLGEFKPAQDYPTLNHLFTRELQKERFVDMQEDVWVSPTDSLVMARGKVEHNLAIQIKGMSYGVSEFLGEVVEDGYCYLNLYLSPKDYHRYHAPCDMEVVEVRYFGGELLPVNQKSLFKNHNLFIRNERVVVVAKDQRGRKFFYVAVGALNVGQMLLHFEPRLQTNARANECITYAYQEPVKIKKGREMGMFKMGSTVVLIASGVNFELEEGRSVKFGERIGSFV
ncbi:phosphatidylserine decarboxylase [Helicobacter kayseriensis]|uniref:phosphatidylserine decarboxylase n=1 Tax=Helicobacter kayseriensis TaxID=2905877 RepID=UPI001E571D83|nr:phosphatidylserine decarboxylase [Helicobacter kayseriensis]MCE3047563.1 phosphatidylserine decarboxylase [Helicobacter kayseriensis]MCE3048885.1 phosphatidylserine decarboxylase [Helicobacter kayseriensis]